MLDFETAMELGEKIGTISSAKNLNEFIGGDFLRIRFKVHVSKTFDMVFGSFLYKENKNLPFRNPFMKVATSILSLASSIESASLLKWVT